MGSVGPMRTKAVFRGETFRLENLTYGVYLIAVMAI